jgi:hypothetical protein
LACDHCTDGCSRCTLPGNRGTVENGKWLDDFCLQDPLPDEVCDPRLLKSFFASKKKYIPYSGYVDDSNHSVLYFIHKLAELSPTLSGCREDIGFHAFGGQMIVEKIDNRYFKIKSQDSVNQPDNQVGIEIQQQFIDRLMEIDLSGQTWETLPNNLYQSLFDDGNIYLKARVDRSMGISKRTLTWYPQQEVLYLIQDDPFASDVVHISRFWDHQWVRKYPPVEVPVYPNFKMTGHYNEGDGSVETMIHVKTNAKKKYGRPIWWGAYGHAYLETKGIRFLINAVHNNFVVEVLMEFEAGKENPVIDDKTAQEKGYKNTADRIIKNFTNRSKNQQSVIATQRPYGSQPTFIHEFDIKTKEKLFKYISDECKDTIIPKCQWSKNLLGIRDTGVAFAASPFIEELMIKMPMLKAWQNKVNYGAINTAIDFMDVMDGETRFLKLGINHESPFQKIIDSVNQKDLQKTQKIIDNTGNQNQNQK